MHVRWPCWPSCPPSKTYHMWPASNTHPNMAEARWFLCADSRFPIYNASLNVFRIIWSLSKLFCNRESGDSPTGLVLLSSQLFQPNPHEIKYVIMAWDLKEVFDATFCNIVQMQFILGRLPDAKFLGSGEPDYTLYLFNLVYFKTHLSCVLMFIR